MNAADLPPDAPDDWRNLSAASRAILLEIIIHGARPRVGIARRLGVSKSGLTLGTRSLLQSGLVREGATELRSPLGRPSGLLEVIPDALHFAGIKLTGDHLHAVVTNLRAEIVAAHDEPLLSRDPEHVVAQVGTVIQLLTDRVPRVVGVGIALAGSLVREDSGRELVQHSAFLGWNDVPVAEMIRARSILPVSVENDVHALTAAEHWFGAGAGLESVALITIGAGIGCGLVVNGELVEGINGMAGMVSHIPVRPGGPLCDQGHSGCAAAYLTNSAIAAAADPVREGDGSYESALQRARDGDPVALAAFRDAGFALGVLVGLVTNLIDPQRTILTGDGLALWEISSSEVAAGIESTAAGSPNRVELEIQPFDFSEWARAAAILALRSALAP